MQNRGYGGLSKGLEHPKILVSAGGSWNKFPMDTKSS